MTGLDVALLIAAAVVGFCALLVWGAWAMLGVGIRIGRREEGPRIVCALNTINCVNYQTAAHQVACLLRKEAFAEAPTERLPVLVEPPKPVDPPLAVRPPDEPTTTVRRRRIAP